MDGKIDVSIIMPSLNVAPYIRESLESVLNQTLKSIEILCVDAGSTDGTLEILQEYTERDSRVKLIQSEKKSYGYQMNLGVSLAQGKYIGIVETDDLVDEHMFKELYNVAEEKKLDFVKADAWQFKVQADGEKKKWYGSIITQPRYRGFYNTVLCPEENLQVYTFMMMTWSGIYCREFLLANRIWHNESAGAAFQDNGFWFQTLMYARRAMFLDKAYYMYRRDNPHSSVYQKGQIYAHRLEYDFIKRILMQDVKKWERFRYVYSWARFEKFFFDLERIAEDSQLEFCKEIGQDFAMALKMGELDKSLFLKEHWEELRGIAENPERYYAQMVQGKNELLERLRGFEDIILCGDENIGRKMFRLLAYRDSAFPIKGFAVAGEAEKGLSEFLGTEVYCLEELQAYRKQAAVLVAATTKRNKEELTKTLESQGFQHIFYMPVFWPEDSEEEEKCLLKETVTEAGKEKLLSPFGFREYIKEQYSEEYLPALYGTWEQFSDIDFDMLPKAFILGFTHYKDMEMFIPNKANQDFMDLGFVRRSLSKYLYEDMGEAFRNVPKAIWALEFVGDFAESRILYRFLCKRGCVEEVCVEERDFQREGFNVRRDFYDCNWNLLNKRVKYPCSEKIRVRPEGWEDIIRMAGEIAEGFTKLIVDAVYYHKKWYTMGAGLWLDGIAESLGMERGKGEKIEGLSI